MDHILKGHVTAISGQSPWANEYSCLNNLTMKEMAIALVAGYVIAKTPEEQLLEAYNKSSGTTYYEKGYREGMQRTLELLDKKVEGINI